VTVRFGQISFLTGIMVRDCDNKVWSHFGHKVTFSFLTGIMVRDDLGEVERGDVDWIGLAKDRNRWRALVDSVMNLRVP
jgi:hypothetical protein